jgi:hypothetical protein
MDIYVESETALERVRQLNDEARMFLPDGRVMLSRSIAAKPADEIADILARVRAFDAFTSHNDPYGEHDFGSFLFGDERIFWKIDYYDRSGEHYGSPDPADPRVTTRVLTVMLANEW